jgi:L-ascorbate metabolism protein UlaG (beta-lactamase superfamily)
VGIGEQSITNTLGLPLVTVATPPAVAAKVVFVGHATTLVAMDGTRLLTDPLLRTRVAHLRRAGPVPAVATRGVDAVVISHLHYDHLDVPSLQRLGRDVPVIVPRGAGGFVRRKTRAHQVLELSVGEELSVGSVRIVAVHAEHDSQRLPFGVSAEPLGFVFRGTRSIYFAGDTDRFAGMTQLGPLDVALVPIWGWGPALGAGHLDPEGAARALALLRPSVAIPIHWGTYYPVHHGVLSPPDWLSAPPDVFAAAAARLAPDVAIRILRPGEEKSV